MLTQNIKLKNFKKEKQNKKIFNLLKNLLKEKNEIINSFSKFYRDSYTKSQISKLKKFANILIIGMGGSILGAKAINSFLKDKIKKNLFFKDNLVLEKKNFFFNKNPLNLIISKSGNTLETIVNLNTLIKKNQKNIFVTENKKNYLTNLAKKLKAEIINHNNYIGGRYSVLSEVGMLPAELMGLNPKKFRQFNELIKNKNFLNSLILNVSNIVNLTKSKKFNSVILNYDEKSKDLFYWYQQLVAESLGKKGKGILPIISNMPKDNHSVMQYYLDGNKNNFYTFFFVNEKKTKKLNKDMILKTHNYLKTKTPNDILFSQFSATEKVLSKKNIPYRCFEIKKRDEKTLGELFIFFMLETILLGKALNINPYDQPSVELIKTETKKILIKS
tara:strand:+ start:526 stop:1689 length:1164 start_codon:yes stop_codon:yes gene_type:complete